MYGWDYIREVADARVARIGETVLESGINIYRFFTTMISTLSIGLSLDWLTRPAVKHVMIRQLYFTGVQSLFWVIMIALSAGALAVYNIVIFAKSIDDLSLIGRLISGLLVEEVAPLLITFFLLTRSGVAVVTEIGSMYIRGEDLMLHSLGISIKQYLFWPRVFAFAFCGLVLTLMFLFVSIWFGGFVLAWSYELNFADFMLEVQRGMGLSTVAILLIKGTLYPTFCTIMLLNQGCQVGSNPNMIPIRATKGVLGSLILVLMMDVLLFLLQAAL